jgi:hypothetical protein
MDTRMAALTASLPTLYAEGETVGGFTGTWGAVLDGYDEATAAVQRAHWFDATPDLAEAAALAGLLDIGVEEFHADLREYRAWVHALVDGAVSAGLVTREGIRVVVDRYGSGFQAATAIDMFGPLRAWPTPEEAGERRLPELRENPLETRFLRLPETGGWEPLARLTVTNGGLDPAPWAAVLTGTEVGGEYAPLLANRTTGHTIVWRGAIGVGQRLVIAPAAEDRTRLRAILEGVDVSDRLDVYPHLRAPAPGDSYAADRLGTKDPALPSALLARGDNEMWFLPLAHFDTPGLSRFLLALADDALRTGRFDQTLYDESLFAQPPRVAACVAWVEAVPASIELVLPGQALLTVPGDVEDGLAARERLAVGLGSALDRCAAAGVATAVRLAHHHDAQPSADRLVMTMPATFRDLGSSGGDRLVSSEGTFTVTTFDDSTLA